MTATAFSTPLLITHREAARLLSVSEKNLFTIVKAGEIPAVRIGRKGVRYSYEHLQKYIQERIDATRSHRGTA